MNNDRGFIEVDPLETALKEMASDGILRAICHPSVDGKPLPVKIDLPYKEIANLSKQEILSLLDEEVKKRGFEI